jgi:hypothetical protein
VNDGHHEVAICKLLVLVTIFNYLNYSYLINFGVFFVNDQVTAMTIDILRQEEEQNTVISQEDAEEYAMHEVLGVRRD